MARRRPVSHPVGLISRRLWAILVVICASWLPAVAAANMASPYLEGQPVGEPWGSVAAIAIEHETLDIDLRPLAQENLATVSATYQINNGQQSKNVDLMFVAAALSGGSPSATNVWLDGNLQPSSVAPAGALPASWQPPQTTPGLDGGEPLSYFANKGSAVYFTLPLSHGMHTIKVQYLAQATAFSGDVPSRYWQLGYVLAPARQWASFGGLDVSVEVPSGWKAASSPALNRNGDTLTGSFDSIPADSLAVTTRYPAVQTASLSGRALLAAFVAFLLIMAIAGTALIRCHRRFGWIVPIGFLLTTVWLGLFFWYLNPAHTSVPASQDAWTYGYGSGITSGIAIIFMTFAIFATLISALVLSLFAIIRRRTSRISNS